MNKTELTDKKSTDERSNRLTWHELDKLKAEDKEALIEQSGCILIFDAVKKEIYSIEKVEL